MQRAEPVVLPGYLPSGTATEITLSTHGPGVALAKGFVGHGSGVLMVSPHPLPSATGSAKGCERLGRSWVWDAPEGK